MRIGQSGKMAFLLATAVLLAGCAASGPPAGFAITVSATATGAGPYICINGAHFSPEDQVLIAYVNTPALAAGDGGARQGTVAQADPAGGFSVRDVSQAWGSYSVQCTEAQKRQMVSVAAIDKKTGFVATATLPAGYWCTNDTTVPREYNEGCR